MIIISLSNTRKQDFVNLTFGSIRARPKVVGLRLNLQSLQFHDFNLGISTKGSASQPFSSQHLNGNLQVHRSTGSQ